MGVGVSVCRCRVGVRCAGFPLASAFPRLLGPHVAESVGFGHGEGEQRGGGWGHRVVNIREEDAGR